MKTVNCIHKKGYIHQDLKPNNIIIYKERPIIIDFGAAIKYKKVSNKKILLTPGFSPIEFYSEKSKQGPYSDIYSLAAILYYYLTESIPLEANDRIIEDQLRSIPGGNSEKYVEFLESTIMDNLSLDYRKRAQSISKFKFNLLKQFYMNSFKEKILSLSK